MAAPLRSVSKTTTRFNARYLYVGGLCAITIPLAILGVEHVFRSTNEPGSPGLKAGVIVILSVAVLGTGWAANRWSETADRFGTTIRVGTAFGAYGFGIAVLISTAHTLGAGAALDWSFIVAVGGLAGLAVGIPIGDGYAKLRRQRVVERLQKDQLRRNSRRMRILYRVARHNIRTEANIMLGYTDLIAGTAHGPTQEYADTLREHASRLERISKNVRRLRRIWETSEEAVETSIQSLTERALSKNQYRESERLTLALDDDAIVASPPFAHWALEEAVDNALTHTDDDTAVTVRTENLDDCVRLIVEDDGPGIPPIEVKSLGSKTESQLMHGQGLGLQVIHWAMEVSDASLSITERESGGTRVLMEFPVERSE
ncbi:HAMP domain-containing histidine kinase [Halorubrum sp. SS5]|uniref:ATP-binding protein n=2 Tax=unclassified Halorubrum TaxID=2642239 RepID=UPI0010F7D3D0|nr:HAMP domain-containing sensor histidine kinase [Halorubrum sp. SS7]TKX57002.1 HAMP domain-containing histidine kinase [Halorubrum sp. SS7]TKX84376.1 HAMP domain-containing histidine kinase [Halorubrum sp. SS5]